MLRKEKRQLSFYSILYENIPKDHILKRIDEAVDFAFVNDLMTLPAARLRGISNVLQSYLSPQGEGDLPYMIKGKLLREFWQTGERAGVDDETSFLAISI
jgi:hypothetical protein